MSNKNNNAKTRKRRARRGNAPSAAPVLTPLVRPPPSFMRGTDVVPMRLKGTRSLLNEFGGTASAGSANMSLCLTPVNISAAGYTSLKQIFPVLNSMQNSFTKFTITRLRVDVRSISATTGGGYVAFCYEAAGASQVAPPVSIADASSGAHCAIVTPGTTGGFTVNCTNYENDWAELGGDSTLKADCGSLQFISENPLLASAVCGLITIEVDFFFTGYRVAP